MKIWHFLSNVFLLLALRSFRKGVKISIYHDAQLAHRQSIPFFGGLYAFYHPLHEAFINAYNAWVEQGGIQVGQTLTLDQLQKQMRSKLDVWEPAIMVIYPKSTGKFKSLFPQGRKPFTRNSRDLCIKAVKQLSNKMIDDGNLAVIKQEIDLYYDELNSARNLQLGEIGDTGTDSNFLKQTIKEVMVGMYSNLGQLMSHFAANPSEVAPFFDLETIRNRNQIIFKHVVPAQSIHNMLEHTFQENDALTIENDGDVPLQFYLAPTATTPIAGLQSVTVEPHETKDVLAQQLGNIAHPFLNAYNPDEITDGHCSIEL
jgi:hypothetical protein